MEPRHLLRVALVAELAVGAVGLCWVVLRGLPLETGPVVSSLAIGAVAAAFLALVNYYVLRHAPDVAPVRSLRRVYHEMLEPLFARMSPRDIVLISLAAGVCEELLFRGAIQQEWGIVPASLLFGIAHLGGSGTSGFGLWAAVIGSFLGWLAIASGGLLAPIVAHAVYDAVALAYIRWHTGKADRGPWEHVSMADRSGTAGRL